MPEIVMVLEPVPADPPAPGPPAPHPQLYPAALAGSAAHLRHLRDEEGADLFATDGVLSALARAAEAGSLEALGVFLEAAPPQGQLDDGLAGAIRGGHRPCAEALLAAGADPLGVYVLESATQAARDRGDPSSLLLCLGALAARGRAALGAGLADLTDLHFVFSGAVSDAARPDSLGPLAALLEFGRWAAGGGDAGGGDAGGGHAAPPEFLGRAASRAFVSAVVILAEEWDAAGWAPVARLLARGGADPQLALARLAPRPPPAAEARRARVQEAWAAAAPPRWGAAEEAALDAEVAPLLQELGALLAGA
jgi:hypothetical protein